MLIILIPLLLISSDVHIHTIDLRVTGLHQAMVNDSHKGRTWSYLTKDMAQPAFTLAPVPSPAAPAAHALSVRGNALSTSTAAARLGPRDIPSCKKKKNYGKSQFLMGKATINGHVQ